MAHDDDARIAKRARLSPSAGDVDLISGLDDDVLLRVFELVPDARDAVRTGALSRRWLGLWRRVPTLRFAASLPVSSGGAALERYVSFVNGILARRRITQSADCAIENLAISYATDDSEAEHMQQKMPAAAASLEAGFEHNLKQLMSASIDAVQCWIRYAFQHGLKSFMVNLHFPDDDDDVNDDEEEDDDDGGGGEKGCEKEPEVLLDGLPSPVGLETLRLALGGARVRLPTTTVKFESLTDLSLERIKVADGGGAHLLARLVSSASCPSLQKLRMTKIWLPDFGEEMRLEADTLSELWVEDVDALRSLDLRTPSLRFFHIDACYNEVLRISAPKLEEVEFFQLIGPPPRRLEVVDGELPYVRSLKICLWSHRACVSGYGEAENDINMLLLKQCISVTRLDVTLKGRKVFEKDVDMIKSRVPHLPQITCLIVNVTDLFERHDFGAGVASLLTRFSNLRHISLHLPFFGSLYKNPGADALCDRHPNHWTSNAISVAHLQEVELTGLTGTDCELWFMKTMLASAERLRKVTIIFNPKCQHPGKMDAFERMLLDEGLRRTSQHGTYMLTCLK